MAYLGQVVPDDSVSNDGRDVPTSPPTPDASLPVRSALLHRPNPPVEAIDRPQLLSRLTAGAELPLSIVCAPAGFGKTILVSQWSESIEKPVAWLSADETIDDLRWFLAHLVASVDAVAPGVLDRLSEILAAPELPAHNALLTALGNELDEMDEPIVVVLDDYEAISSTQVHTLVADLLRHPPAQLHLVLITRKDPPLPVGVLRARGRLSELGMPELAFSEREVAAVASQEGNDVPPENAKALHAATEGWAAGIRLGLEAKRSGDPELTQIPAASFLDENAQDYLAAEVLDHEPPEVRRYLVATSYFHRFTAEMCEAAAAHTSAGPPLMTGAEFLEWARRHNLFLVPLDDEGRWFRFHNLFARLLANWRRARHSGSDTSGREVCRAAIGVLIDLSEVDEAIELALSSGEAATAARLAVEKGNTLLNEERWAELERLLQRIPSETLAADPSLLVLRGWVLGDVRSRHKEMNQVLDRAEHLLDDADSPLQATDEKRLRGEIAAQRGAYSRMMDADFEGAVLDAELARELLATTGDRQLAFAYVVNVLALAGAGHGAEAHSLARSVMGDERFAEAPFNPMLWALCYLGWMEGDLPAVETYAAQLLATGERFGLRDTIATAHYFLGVCAYERDHLADAEVHLNAVMDLRFNTMSINAVHSDMALAFTCLARGDEPGASELGREVMEIVVEGRSDYLQPVAEAFMAELDLRAGQLAPALTWAERADPDPRRHHFMFYDPTPTLVKVLLAGDTTAERGAELLTDVLDNAARRHNRPLTVAILGVKALHLADEGDEPGALDVLEEAVRLSAPGGMIRHLADLGDGLVPLLPRLDLHGAELAHAGAVLTAIEGSSKPKAEVAASSVAESSVASGSIALTARELDVLRLLAERYSNKEIAAELVIATATVKKYTVTLYQKLNVHGRRAAVAKAKALGYLDD